MDFNSLMGGHVRARQNLIRTTEKVNTIENVSAISEKRKPCWLELVPMFFQKQVMDYHLLQRPLMLGMCVWVVGGWVGSSVCVFVSLGIRGWMELCVCVYLGM